MKEYGEKYRDIRKAGGEMPNYPWREPNIDKHKGYVRISVPSTTGYKRRYEHTVIAEKVLGRPLKKGEQVHHINGDKTDNRNCNLLICDVGYHAYLHAKMAELYQREHFGAR
jgi:HNH endonuclease